MSKSVLHNSHSYRWQSNINTLHKYLKLANLAEILQYISNTLIACITINHGRQTVEICQVTNSYNKQAEYLRAIRWKAKSINI